VKELVGRAAIRPPAAAGYAHPLVAIFHVTFWRLSFISIEQAAVRVPRLLQI